MLSVVFSYCWYFFCVWDDCICDCRSEFNVILITVCASASVALKYGLCTVIVRFALLLGIVGLSKEWKCHASHWNYSKPVCQLSCKSCLICLSLFYTLGCNLELWKWFIMSSNPSSYHGSDHSLQTNINSIHTHIVISCIYFTLCYEVVRWALKSYW